METIPESECVKIGYLQKPHGIHGEFLLSFEDKFEDSISNISMCLLKIEGLLVPFFISDNDIRIRSSVSAYVKFKWIDSGEKAREFSGSEIFLKKEDIVVNENKDVFEIDKLIGFNVFDQHKNDIGIITTVDNFSGNIVLTVNFKGREIMIPYHEGLVNKLDIQANMLQLMIPSGLLDDDQD